MRALTAAVVAVVVVIAAAAFVATRSDGPTDVTPQTAGDSHRPAVRPPTKTPRARADAGETAPTKSDASPAVDPDAVPTTEETAEVIGMRERTKHVPERYFAIIEERIRRKASEQIVETTDPVRDQRDGLPVPGTLAAARRWLDLGLPREAWETVMTDLRLPVEMVQRAWRKRPRGETRTASYGTGSHIAARKSTDEQTSQPGHPDDETWWAGRSAEERAQWMTAWFVERTGYFEIVDAEVDRFGTRTVWYR